MWIEFVSNSSRCAKTFFEMFRKQRNTDKKIIRCSFLLWSSKEQLIRCLKITTANNLTLVCENVSVHPKFSTYGQRAELMHNWFRLTQLCCFQLKWIKNLQVTLNDAWCLMPEIPRMNSHRNLSVSNIEKARWKKLISLEVKCCAVQSPFSQLCTINLPRIWN